MNRYLAAALTLFAITGCLTPEQREAREAKREAKRAEKEARRGERDAQNAANQQAQADAEAGAQFVNMENLCTNISQAHAARCNTDAAATYLWCLGSSAPATISAVTWAETQRCHADIGGADCNVIASGVLPASCAQGSAADAQAAQPVSTDPGGVTVARHAIRRWRNTATGVGARRRCSNASKNGEPGVTTGATEIKGRA